MSEDHKRLGELISEIMREQSEAESRFQLLQLIRIFGSEEEARKEFERTPLTLVEEKPAVKPIDVHIDGRITIHRQFAHLAMQIWCPVHHWNTVGPRIESHRELERQKAAYIKGELRGICCQKEQDEN